MEVARTVKYPCSICMKYIFKIIVFWRLFLLQGIVKCYLFIIRIIWYIFLFSFFLHNHWVVGLLWFTVFKSGPLHLTVILFISQVSRASWGQPGLSHPWTSGPHKDGDKPRPRGDCIHHPDTVREDTEECLQTVCDLPLQTLLIQGGSGSRYDLGKLRLLL